jgi:septal ring factor EnvC (AmiA/AmiB activator)
MAKEKVDTIDKLAALIVEGFSDMESRFEEVNLALGHVQDDVRSVRYDVKDLKSEVAEIKSEIKAHGKAIDKDALALINHERRISKLEHTR